MISVTFDHQQKIFPTWQELMLFCQSRLITPNKDMDLDFRIAEISEITPEVQQKVQIARSMSKDQLISI
jgi:hypothetical protein